MNEKKSFPVFYNGEEISLYIKESCIYSFLNIKNKKRYIGQTDNLQRRTTQHLRDLKAGRDYCSLLQNAWNKYGEESFIIEILEFCSIEELDEKEEYYIKEYKSLSFENGYNIFRGGISLRGEFHPLKGKVFTEEEIRKRKESAPRGENHQFWGKKRDPEVLIKAWKKRRENGNDKFTEESKVKLRESLKNRPPVSEETRRKLSSALKGRKMDEESVRKATISKIGKLKKNSKNNFPGITFEKSSNKWIAQCEVKGKSIKMGRFLKEEDAFIAYVNKMVEVYGEGILENFREYLNKIGDRNE